MASEYTIKLGLKPCPFCGETRDIRNEPNIYESDGRPITKKKKRKEPPRYIVKCGNCFARTIWADTQEDAFAFWQAGMFDETTKMLNDPIKADIDIIKINMQELRNDMIETLFTDLKEAYVDKYRHHKRGPVEGEAWFLSEELTAWTDISGDSITKAAKSQAKYDIWRIKHGCKGCKRKGCPHANGLYPWRAFTNGTAPDCPVFRGGFIDDSAQARLDRTMWAYLQMANGVEDALWKIKRFIVS